MFPRHLTVWLALVIMIAVAAATTGRADACRGIDLDCRVEGSLRVHFPAITDPGIPPTPVIGPVQHAWADAAASPLPGDSAVICNTLLGRPGGFQPPGNPDEVAFTTALFGYPPASQSRGYTGNIDFTTVYGGTLVNARLYALRCNPALLYPAMEACMRRGVHTPGVVHASPLTGVVNARSLFWLEGVLANDDRLWLLGASATGGGGQCDPAHDGAACIWDDATSPTSDGVWLTDGELTYTDNRGTHTVDCDTIGGILDPVDGACPQCATGRAAATSVVQTFTGDPLSPVDSGERLNHGSDPAVFAQATAVDGSWGDTDGDGIIDVDRFGRPNHHPDTGVTGNIVITRRLDPVSLGASIHLDFGPWQWEYDAAAAQDQRAYGQTTPTRGTGPGWDLFADFIATTPGVNARGDDLSAVPGAALDALICDPAQSSCTTGYAGPAHAYETHGLHRLRVLVGRSLGSSVTRAQTGVAVSKITFAVDDVYDWTETWDHEPVAQRFAWSARSSAGGSSDCRTTADANEQLGSTCNTTRFRTGWVPSIHGDGADPVIAGPALYSYERTYTDCDPWGDVVAPGDPGPTSATISDRGGVVSGGSTVRSCSYDSALYRDEPTTETQEVCDDPPNNTLNCRDEEVEVTNSVHIWDVYVCDGSVTVTHQAPLSASQHCSARGTTTEIAALFDAANPGNQAVAETTPPTVTNVITNITPNIGRNNNLLDKDCGWRRTGLSWEHRHHAYWSCHSDARTPTEWNHEWYEPSIGAVDAVTSDGTPNPTQPLGGAECRSQHTLVVQPAALTIPLRPRALPDAAVPYACALAGSPSCPDTCGTQDGVDHGYPVIRREPILARSETRPAGLDPVGCPAGTPVGDGVTTPPPPPNAAPTFWTGVRTFYIDENSVWPVAVEDQHGNPGRLPASDADNDPLTYHMGACHLDFYVDNTDGRTIKARPSAQLDYETPPNPYRCTIRVSDPDGASDSTNITIHIRDVNEASGHAPVFSPALYAFVIGEHARPNAAVGTVAATDADLLATPPVGEALTYALTRSLTDLPSNHFAINSATGAITVRTDAVLNAPTKSTYALIATVTDNGGNTAAATVHITVTPEADAVAVPTNIIFDRISYTSLLGLPRIIHYFSWDAPAGSGSRSYDLARQAIDGSGEWVIARTHGPTTATSLGHPWDIPAAGITTPWYEARIRLAGTPGAAWSAPHRCIAAPNAPGC